MPGRFLPVLPRVRARASLCRAFNFGGFRLTGYIRHSSLPRVNAFNRFAPGAGARKGRPRRHGNVGVFEADHKWRNSGKPSHCGTWRRNTPGSPPRPAGDHQHQAGLARVHGGRNCSSVEWACACVSPCGSRRAPIASLAARDAAASCGGQGRKRRKGRRRRLCVAAAEDRSLASRGRGRRRLRIASSPASNARSPATARSPW